MIARTLIAVTLPWLLAVGCASEAGNPDASASSRAGGDTTTGSADGAAAQDGSPDTASVPNDALSTPLGGDAGPDASIPVERPPTGELSAIEPGGDTICSRGTPFRFFAYGGDPHKVVIDFEGGGACWNEFTCSVGDAIFSDDASQLEDLENYMSLGLLQGIYAFDNPDNPFYGWTLIHVPYCTGDIHWGDATVTYNDELTIHHRGFRNVESVRTWLASHYPALTHIVSTGCSAGAYAAIGHAPFLAETYPEAKLTVLADAGCGVITDDFLEQSFPKWNAEANMPLWLDELAWRPISELSLTDFYVAVAHEYPEMRVAQHTTAHDKDQIFYFDVMGGAEGGWSPQVKASLADIRAATDNFRYYLAPGPIHCIHPYDLTYTRVVGGTSYRDWLTALVHDEALPDDVICEG